MTAVDPRLSQIPRELQDTFDKRVYFEELERFLHDLWIRTGGGNDAIESITEEETGASAETARISSRLTRLEARLDDMETNDGYNDLNVRVTRLTRKVNKLISELLEAVNSLKPDPEQESEKIIVSEQVLKELMLLNLRIEEAFETKIVESDVL
jgi:predicted  nucleic acid-binding Zn-ribbon protein